LLGCGGAGKFLMEFTADAALQNQNSSGTLALAQK
jgi:hypothetical protein